jgi:hypothetical protein
LAFETPQPQLSLADMPRVFECNAVPWSSAKLEQYKAAVQLSVKDPTDSW